MAINNTDIEDVIIIGGGPAGLAAALYTARAGLKPLLFAGSPPGGQLMLTSDVENYPGFESILGPELIQKYRTHVQKFGVKIIDQNITKVQFTDSSHTLQTVEKNYRARAVIITTGAKALWLGLENEQRLRGKGVSACATCDGFFFKNKVVAVVGGGDTAMEEALTLTKFSKVVYVIHRRGEFRASKIMQDRVKNHPNIHIIYNAEVSDVHGDSKVEGVTLKIRPSDKKLLKKTKKQLEDIAPKLLQMQVLDINDEFMTGKIPLDGLFLGIGHKPDTDVFKDQIELDEKGYVITSGRIAHEYAKIQDKHEGVHLTLPKERIDQVMSKFNHNYLSATSASGVFAAGDCVDYLYRQAGTAVGMGIASALEVEKWLELNK